MIFSKEIIIGIPEKLPEAKALDPDIDHAPIRPIKLSINEKKLAIDLILYKVLCNDSVSFLKKDRLGRFPCTLNQSH